MRVCERDGAGGREREQGETERHWEIDKGRERERER